MTLLVTFVTEEALVEVLANISGATTEVLPVDIFAFVTYLILFRTTIIREVSWSTIKESALRVALNCYKRLN